MKQFQKNEAKFTAADYAAFGVLLTVPALIGIFFAYKHRNDSTTKRYFFGGKKMNPIAVGISTSVTSISAITMIGYPAEVYRVGTAFFWAIGGLISANIVVYVYFVPFYSKLQLDTIYSYLGLRFNASVQRLITISVVISEIFYMGSVIYVPALALSAVCPIPITWSIVTIGGICTFYTTLGGMNAVVWTDVLQSILMLFAAIAAFIAGTIAVGGPAEIISALQRGQRNNFLKFDEYDISSRSYPMTLLVGETFNFLQFLAFTQTIYQRLLSCKNTRQSKNAVIAYFFPSLCIIGISIANGLMLYAYFEGCDPKESQQIQRYDQALPYMALQQFGNFPGLTGTFVAAIFSGSLSTLSSGMNGYSMVFVEDICPILIPNMRQRMKVIIGKLAALVLGLGVTITAYGISQSGSNIYKLIRTFMGSFYGSLLGIYLLGIFTPWTNSWGAMSGAIAGYTVMLWIFYGSNFLLDQPPRVSLPPVSVEFCPSINFTGVNATAIPFEAWQPTATNATLSNDDRYSVTEIIYSINFHYYVLVGCCTSMIIGLLVSFATGYQRAQKANPRLFLPLISNSRCPERIVKFFRLGVPPENEDLHSQDDNKKSSNEEEMRPLKGMTFE